MRDDIDVRLIDYWLHLGAEKAERLKVAEREAKAKEVIAELYGDEVIPYEVKL